MKLPRAFPYLVAQVVRPASMLLFLGLSARELAVSDFGKFVILLAIADVLSILFDLGGRQLLLGRVRSLPLSARALVGEQVWVQARAVVLVGCGLAALGFLAGRLGESLLVALLAVSLPVVDPHLSALRAKRRPGMETALLVLEATIAVGTFFALLPVTGSGVATPVFALAAGGVVRLLLSWVSFEGRVRSPQSAQLEKGPAVADAVGNFGVRLPLVLSLLLSNAVQRLPVFLFAASLSEIDFAAFAAMWALLSRSQMLVTAVTLERFGDETEAKLARVLVALGVGVGVAVSVLVLAAGDLIVRVFLGPAFATAQVNPVLAAVILIVFLPAFGMRQQLGIVGRAKAAATSAALHICLVLAVFGLASTRFDLLYGAYVAGFFFTGGWLYFQLIERNINPRILNGIDTERNTS